MNPIFTTNNTEFKFEDINSKEGKTCSLKNMTREEQSKKIFNFGFKIGIYENENNFEKEIKWRKKQIIFNQEYFKTIDKTEKRFIQTVSGLLCDEYNELGNRCIQHGEFEQSIDSFECAFYFSNKYEELNEKIKQSTKNKIQNSLSNTIGDMYFEICEYSKSLEWYNRCANYFLHDDKYSEKSFKYGYVLNKLKKDGGNLFHFEDAINNSDDAIQIAYYSCLKAKAMDDLELFKENLSKLEKIPELIEYSTDENIKSTVLYRLSLLAEELGCPLEKKEYCSSLIINMENYLQNDNENTTVLLALARCYFNSCELLIAKQIINKILSVDDVHTTYHYRFVKRLMKNIEKEIVHTFGKKISQFPVDMHFDVIDKA